MVGSLFLIRSEGFFPIARNYFYETIVLGFPTEFIWMCREKWHEKGFIKLFYQHIHDADREMCCMWMWNFVGKFERWEGKGSQNSFDKFFPNFALIVVAAEIMILRIQQKVFNPQKGKKRRFPSARGGRHECHDEINLITNELNLICLLAIFQVIKITKTSWRISLFNLRFEGNGDEFYEPVTSSPRDGNDEISLEKSQSVRFI